MIRSGLSDLENEIEKMSEDEIIIKKPYEIVDIDEKILEFNRQQQQRQGLKIETPNQMLIRLPISLAQLSAGNNSEKLKNKIRQILYSLYEWVNKRETGINSELFKRHFNFQRPSDMLKTVNNTNNRKKKNDLVNVIKSGLSDLENEIEKMSEDEIIIKKPYEIVDIDEKILEFNRQQQQRQGLKILTPNQMLIRSPISLA